jgi:hypothetical protein
MVHLDVKTIDRIPDGSSRRAHGRSEQVRGRGIGYDDVHSRVAVHLHAAPVRVFAESGAQDDRP